MSEMAKMQHYLHDDLPKITLYIMLKIKMHTETDIQWCIVLIQLVNVINKHATSLCISFGEG